MILAIDPSSHKLGFAIFDSGGGLMASGLKILKGDIFNRTREAFCWLKELLAVYAVKIIVVEGLVGKYPGAVIPQARVTGALIAAAPPTIAFEEIPPSRVKKLLLKGNATKEEIAEVAARRYRFDQQNGYDISDAIAVGMAYFVLKGGD